MKRKIERIILGMVAVLVVVSYSSSLLQKGFETVEAATRLYGVQQVVEKISTEDPFVILELVPDEAYASLGSYVLGEEPDVDSRLLKGTNSSAVRREKVLSLFAGLIAKEDAGGVGMTYPMFYDFNTLYQEQLSAPKSEDMAGWKVLEFEPTKNEAGKIIAYHTEDRVGYYEEVGEGGDYTVTVVETEKPSGGTSSEETSSESESSEEVTSSEATESSDTQPDDAEGSDTIPVESSDNTSVEDGDYTATVAETEESSGDVGLEETSSESESSEEEVTSSESESSEEETSSESESSEATESSDDDAEITVTYTYSYTPRKGTYRWVDANTEEASIYPVSFEKLYYKVTLTSNDWFAKSIFEYEENYGTANIEVIPITPSELETNIAKGYLAEYGNKKIQGWNGVDMLYISNSTCMNLSEDEKVLFESYNETVINEQDSTVTYTNDLSSQTAYNIYEYVLNTSLPVIIDSSIVTEVLETQESQENQESSVLRLDTNLQKLAFLLCDYTTETTPASYVKDDTVIDVSSWTTQWPAELTDILSERIKDKTDAETGTKLFGTYGSVQGSVYFNSKPNLVSAGFAKLFASVKFDNLSSEAAYDETTLTGISAVVNEIDSENFYNELNGVDCTTEYNTDTEQIEIYQSSVIKYILNFAYRRAIVYKDSIKVLDIEPTRYSTLTPEKIRGWLKDADAERIEKIEIVQMTTSEFIGVLSDLNAEYDLIYIGGCIGPAEEDGAMNQEDGETVYNDSSMDGLIYTHIGDIYKAPKKFNGLLDTEYNDTRTQLVDEYVITRFSGNDITKEKVEELKDFVNSGYPVVVADKFYGTTDDGVTCINSAYVDNASYLYEFLDYFTTVERKENVMSDDLNESGLLATYVNMSKLYLSMISCPVEYAVTYNSNQLIDSVQYLQAVNGKYTLEYVFELADNSEARLDSVAYEVEVFIDTNADGRYDATEELDGLIVRDYETGAEVPYNQLVTGVRYTVARELPDGYIGMIPWKLEVTQRLKNETSAVAANAPVPVHTSTKGYTAVPAKDVTDINVLQIRSAKGGGLDLSNNGTFNSLFDNIETMMQYNVEVETVTATGYVADYNEYLSDNNLTDGTVEAYTRFYESYFADYDMIMVGFVDMFDDINSDGATMALKLFIESGRSTLFSHDTTSFVNAEWDIYRHTAAHHNWGYYLNQNIRSIVGMDRYGITEEALGFLKKGQSLTLNSTDDVTSKTYQATIEDINKDIAYTIGDERKTSAIQVHGYSNIGLLMQENGGYGDGVPRENSYNPIYPNFPMYPNYPNTPDTELQYDYYDVHYDSGVNENNSRVKAISQVNKGQITSFPYDINIDDSYDQNVKTFETNGDSYQMIDPATLTIQDTHGQYYQLDLNMDKTNDKESDIVVWYCLASGIYDAVPNDVRNNYYIYSVGNITYTGMGHSGNSVSMDEAKLFINTMIASFNAGKKDPSIAIIQNADNKGAIKQYSYRTYDAEFGMADLENEVINFYVNDSNIIAGTKSIALKYYVEIDDNPNDDVPPERKELEAKYIASSVNTINNNEVGTLILKPELFAEAFADPDVGSVKIYISAQTTLDYDSTRPDETTGVAFTNITVKARDLFDLD